MMKTKEQYAQECKDQNPEMVEIINGVERILTKKEYDAAVEAWALMRWYQDNPDQQPAPTPIN
jgi:hypothetical protein